MHKTSFYSIAYSATLFQSFFLFISIKKDEMQKNFPDGFRGNAIFRKKPGLGENEG
jgi:hypothetical protein